MNQVNELKENLNDANVHCKTLQQLKQNNPKLAELAEKNTKLTTWENNITEEPNTNKKRC